MQNNSRAIITSASNKFFPSLLNFIGSIKSNYPNHPPIYVYDLGLHFLFIKQLETIDGVAVLKIPHFVSFWRSCYTWKTYILNTPISNLNLYIDAGNQILRPLDTLFDKIGAQDYLLVSQGPEVSLIDVTPKEYLDMFEIGTESYNKEIITAGIFGFKKDSSISVITKKLYHAAVNGLCLGFSKTEQWKNKGINKNIFVRDCKIFRHDTTLITILVDKYMPNSTIETLDYFSGGNTKDSRQYMWNLRMNYKTLQYPMSLKLNWATKVFLQLFIKAKAVNQFIK